ncbi:hypothetical protein [Blastopirellula marina]|uniref:SnoaL-like domain-containing protein n=1 Tax=Blastopirellula marina TaxID=124 RepID=A0A2S8GBH0_9BACT|nr:hypothetical protein [Blastopirellula marina]PQO41660.1 hypothetical protein C5Y98_02750 [Blastopirellula marina]PTL46103.1 hypothetical protein C5Y97_02750 [Blastopirellula marina]
MRFLGTALLLGLMVSAYAGRPVVAEDSKADWKDTDQVQKDVREMITATYGGEPEELLKFTHPKVVALMGGPEQTKKTLKLILGKFKEMGMKLDEFKFSADPIFLETEQSHFVIVPTNSIMSMGGKKVESQNYQFGQKSKSDKTWKYIEGSRLNQDNVRQFFPDFPKDFEFPKTKRDLL